MTIADYIKLARQTECDYAHSKIDCDTLVPFNSTKLTHYALGLATEALELKLAIEAKRPLTEQLMELGDICWFSALAAAELSHFPQEDRCTQRVIRVPYEQCEEFASAIKAALVYGRPLGEAAKIPAAIFERAVSVSRQVNGSDFDILEANIKKLRARYPNRFEASAANVRDTANEVRAVQTEFDIKKILAK